MTFPWGHRSFQQGAGACNILLPEVWFDLGGHILFLHAEMHFVSDFYKAHNTPVKMGGNRRN